MHCVIMETSGVFQQSREKQEGRQGRKRTGRNKGEKVGEAEQRRPRRGKNNSFIFTFSPSGNASFNLI